MMQETTPVTFCDIGQMNCRPLTTTLTENAEPYSVRTLQNRHCHIQSTLALRTPRYNGHPDNTDRR